MMSSSADCNVTPIGRIIYRIQASARFGYTDQRLDKSSKPQRWLRAIRDICTRRFDRSSKETIVQCAETLKSVRASSLAIADQR
jgi:hypothetical protein